MLLQRPGRLRHGVVCFVLAAMAVSRKPASQRSKDKQATHACSCCGSTSHRLERCSHPASWKIRQLNEQVKRLRAEAKQVRRKEKKWRNAPHKSVTHKQSAKAKYQCKPAAQVTRKRSPAELRKLKPDPMPCDTMNGPEDAAEYLLRNRFLRKPRRCSQCSSQRFSSLKWQRSSLHWRCLACGFRTGLYDFSIFRGLRCLPTVLLKMLCVYASLDLSRYPAENDLIQFSKVGYRQAHHFLAALRRRESEAARKIFAKGSLTGNIEVDGTSLGFFHVRADNVTYQDAIAKIVQSLKKKSKPIPKSFVAHIPVLGARQRDGPPYLWVAPPVLAVPQSRPPTESLAQAMFHTAQDFLTYFFWYSVLRAQTSPFRCTS